MNVSWLEISMVKVWDTILARSVYGLLLFIIIIIIIIFIIAFI